MNKVHYPAHESLGEFAARIRKSPQEAHTQWSNRHYPEITVRRRDEDIDEVTGELRTVLRTYHHPARGPGLALRPQDLR